MRPRQARYQAALRPDMVDFIYSRVFAEDAATPNLCRALPLTDSRIPAPGENDW